MKDPAGEGAEFSLHGLRLGQQLLVAELASLERGLAGLAPRNLAKELAVAGRQSPGVVGQQGGALLHGGQRVAGDPVDPIDWKEGFGEEVLGQLNQSVFHAKKVVSAGQPEQRIFMDPDKIERVQTGGKDIPPEPARDKTPVLAG